jgi:DNA repair photolyase
MVSKNAGMKPSRFYIERQVTRALTPTGGFLEKFAFSLNPYIGCAFGDNGGCPFCYVRMLPVAQTMPGAWGTWVVAKINLPQLLEVELKALEASGKLQDSAVFMSSATDPYQGYERLLKLTHAALEQFVRRSPRRLVLQTRSPLVERDADILRALRDRLIVSLTLETDDERVRRALTPTSPSVARRLLTARRLREAGLFVQLAIAPMLPNRPERFARLAAEAADRVVVDTYAGDGAGGQRSQKLGMEELYRRKLGIGGALNAGAETPLIAAMRARLGPHRVLIGKDGFNMT